VRKIVKTKKGNVVKKPALLVAAEKIGGKYKLGTAIGLAGSNVSIWLYTDKLIAHKHADNIEKLTGVKIPASYRSNNKTKIFKTTKSFLTSLIEKAGSQGSLCKILKMDRSLLSRLKTTDQKIPLKFVQKICDYSDGNIKLWQLRPDIFNKKGEIK
jgi:DNA-binding Xre family transcriptional regulator